MELGTLGVSSGFGGLDVLVLGVWGLTCEGFGFGSVGTQGLAAVHVFFFNASRDSLLVNPY